MNEFNHRKAVQALNFFSEKNGGKIEKMKAIKLLWLSDRVHLLKYGRMITGDTYFALQHGPVPSKSMNIIDGNVLYINEDKIQYGFEYLSPITKKEFETKSSTNLKVFSESDREVLTLVYQKFGSYSSSKLREISHYFTEWKRFEHTFVENPKASMKMNEDDFFENNQILSEFGINIDDEVLQLNKEYFTEFA